MSSKVKADGEVYKFKPHGPWLQVAGKKWCFKCGLVALNNESSEWCVDKGCLYDLHVQYSSAMRRLTKGGK